MEAKGLMQKGNTLKVELDVINLQNINKMATLMSPEYVICGATVFQVKVIAANEVSGYSARYKSLVFIRFTKRHSHDQATYTMQITSDQLGLRNMCFTTDDCTWRLVNENTHQNPYTIDVSVQVDLDPKANIFVSLYEDTTLTDIELRGVDGSVHFHKFVLAASSPVLMTMVKKVSSDRNEDPVLQVLDTSKKTIQDLKNYIYLKTLPDEDLEQLLLLSSLYMMPDLEQKCVNKLVTSLTAQNACDLLEFSANRRMTKLLVAILECVQNRVVDVNEISVNCLPVSINGDMIENN